MNKTVLIDGNAILHRAFHALPPLTTKSGEPINAVYGLISMLLKVIQDINPTHIAVCFDEKGPTFRNELFKEYQSQRPETMHELIGQFSKARDVVKALNIPIYSQEGFEADDLLGTLSKKISDDVVIVTGDRDILQLVNDRVKIYMPVVGLSTGKLYGNTEVIERMGVNANQIDDFKALVGDPSDNYPGVPGIGPKTAITLLTKYQTLDGVYSHLDEIKGSTKEKLEKGRESAVLSKKLATIVCDVPIEYNFDDMGKWDVDSPKVLKLFEEYGFKTLTERVKKVGKEIDSQKQVSLF